MNLFDAREDLDDLLYGLAMALREMADGRPGLDWWRISRLGLRALGSAL